MDHQYYKEFDNMQFARRILNFLEIAIFKANVELYSKSNLSTVCFYIIEHEIPQSIQEINLQSGNDSISGNLMDTCITG